jgi:hypothetical protein
MRKGGGVMPGEMRSFKIQEGKKTPFWREIESQNAEHEICAHIGLRLAKGVPCSITEGGKTIYDGFSGRSTSSRPGKNAGEQIYSFKIFDKDAEVLIGGIKAPEKYAGIGLGGH